MLKTEHQIPPSLKAESAPLFLSTEESQDKVICRHPTKE